MSVDDRVTYMFFMDIFLFYSLLEGFLLVFKFFIKLVCILYFGKVFKYAKPIFKLIFENPYPLKGGWIGDHALYAKIENHFNMCINRVVIMSYTLDSHYVFNWYRN